MCQYGYITPAFKASPWWGEINLERSGCGGNEHKLCEKGWNWVKTPHPQCGRSIKSCCQTTMMPQVSQSMGTVRALRLRVPPRPKGVLKGEKKGFRDIAFPKKPAGTTCVQPLVPSPIYVQSCNNSLLPPHVFHACIPTLLDTLHNSTWAEAMFL